MLPLRGFKSKVRGKAFRVSPGEECQCGPSPGSGVYFCVLDRIYAIRCSRTPKEGIE